MNQVPLRHWIIKTSFILLAPFIFHACSTSKNLTHTHKTRLDKKIAKSAIFANDFTGFALMDAASGESIYEYQAGKYFTPASNAKIFTFYTCLHLLGDSIPALRYEVRGDSLLFWGTGDPGFLNTNLDNNQAILRFLQTRKEKLFFCNANFQDNPFGPGWAWDDYNYYFQPEKSGLPIYGNTVRFAKDENSIQYTVQPPLFAQAMVDRPELNGRNATVKRQWDSNVFEYNIMEAIPNSFQGKIPFHYSDQLLLAMLGELLGKKVALYPKPEMPGPGSQTIYSSGVDAVYREMMQESDNFVAEQLLLVCANQAFDTLSSRKIIDLAQREFMQDLPDAPIWVDGSGLSRYNLFTPRSITRILYKTLLLTGKDYLLKIFPAGGQSGTLKNWYGGGPAPYVFAKTGTLNNQHCLSGYLVAKSGKLLVFSFMNNNFPGGSRPIKEEMEKVLRELYLIF